MVRKILPLFICVMLVGCDAISDLSNITGIGDLKDSVTTSAPLADSSSIADSSNIVIDSSEPIADDSTPVNVTSTMLSTNPIYSEISISDVLSEIRIGKYLALGNTYPFSFSFANSSAVGASVSSSRPNILEYQNIDGVHTLVPMAAGETVLTIRDVDNIIHFRYVVVVREKIAPSAVYDYLENSEVWVSKMHLIYQYTMVFLPGNSGIFKGNDEGSIIEAAPFTYELVAYDEEEFLFEITSFENEYSSFIFVEFTLTRVGDMIHVADQHGYFDAMRLD